MLELSRDLLRPLGEAKAQVVEVIGWEHVVAAQTAGRALFFDPASWLL